MTHKQQLVAMLDNAGIEYGYSGGDSILSHNCRFRFYVDGKLKSVEFEGGDSDGNDY